MGKRLEHIRLRLENWASWCARGGSGGSGWSRSNILAHMSAPNPSRESTVPVLELDAHDTHDAIESLRYEHPHLYLTVHSVYRHGRGARGTATHLCKGESTVHLYLAQADALIDRWLQKQQAQRVQRRICPHHPPQPRACAHHHRYRRVKKSACTH